MILHVGEALIDFIPVLDADGNPSYKPSPGGSPYNSSIATARLGAHSLFVGRVSRDFFGDQLVGRLEGNGVETSHIVRSEQPSALAFVKKTDAGEARYAFFVENTADRSLVADDLPGHLPGDVESIGFGSISLIGEPAGETIVSFVEHQAEKVVASFDPNVRTVLLEDESVYRDRVERACRAAGIIKISDEDLEWFRPGVSLEEAASGLLGGNTKLVVVTKGADGAFAVTGREYVEAQAVKTEVSDTVGAGDSFHSALLVWLSKTGRLSHGVLEQITASDLRGMLDFAVRVAAKTCSRPGADPPHEHEVEL
jgi:fructokinase